MTKTLTFSGWGQKHTSLQNICGNNATHIHYAKHSSIDALFDALKNTETDLVIGWSLGGQLALRAINEGIIRTKKLVLLATPFQFIKSNDLKCGMSKDNFEEFKTSYQTQPEKTLQRFAQLIAKNDTHQKNIAKTLLTNFETHENWVYWLNQLGKFSCKEINFNTIPDTLIIHGIDDTIVDFSQTSLFMPFIPPNQILSFDKCGHAPHLHDTNKVNQSITSFYEQQV